ncbi:MAG: hypothetical protein A2073_03650 [Deltaproteobacteria bacterium GWC2_42_11]|nr:MAG: hypothetical protein A2073_03650 [Deltaproteobacteria bacterium GWC2_42_11]HBO84014.1 hypothetical protein [Deltaproteobacteria bacterium]
MLYKRGDVWWTKIMFNGALIRKSTGTVNKELARKIALKIKGDIVSGEWFKKDPAETILFAEVWDKYLKEDARYKAPRTYQRAIQVGDSHLLSAFANLTLSEITPAVLSAYKAKRLEAGVKIGTAAKELHFIRRVFSLCKREWQLVKQSPFEFFKMPKFNDQRVRYLEHGELDRLLFHCPAWLKSIVTLARYTGMRRGNILSLTWSQVDFQNRVITLGAEDTKNRERLIIPLAETPYNVLAGMKNAKVVSIICPFVFNQDGKPYNPHQLSMAFNRACRRAGIENFRFHDLRHDFASNLVQRGNDLYVVQHLLGHKDGRMTQRYAHLRLENLKKAVETLETGHNFRHSENEKGIANLTTP